MQTMMLSRFLLGALLALLAGCSSSDQTAADQGAVEASVDLRHSSDAAGDLARDRSSDLLPADLAPDLAPCELVGVYSSKNAACNDCAEARCCSELNSCFAAPECNDDYVNCTLACAMSPEPDGGVPACLELCATEHATGKALYDAAMGCAEAECATECQ